MHTRNPLPAPCTPLHRPPCHRAVQYALSYLPTPCAPISCTVLPAPAPTIIIFSRLYPTLTQIQKVLKIVETGLGGAAFQSATSTLPKAAMVLLQALKRTGAKVIGSPQSFLSLRSKVMATNMMYGPYTCMLNLCPSESATHWIFTLSGGETITFDCFGKPENRPGTAQVMKIVSANPKACADFLDAYFRSFFEVFLGWDMASDKQTNPNCIFGLIYSAYMKYETSGRGGKHGHGQICQPALQSANLHKLLNQGEATQKMLFDFMESFACTYIANEGVHKLCI